MEILTHNTIRIEVLDSLGNPVSSGTGFFLAFYSDESKSSFRVYMVTNKHVIENANRIRLTFTVKDENKEPLIGIKETLILGQDFINSFIPHNSSNIDLTMLNLTDLLLNYRTADGKELYFAPIFEDLIPTNNEWSNLDSMEEIVMIGYPKGLWDETNNLPLIRRGVTSSSPAYNFNGKPEFVIDAACFPGSSGSPVFLYNTGSYFDKNTNSLQIGNRLKFLGVLYSGPLHCAQGMTLNAPVLLESGKVTSTPVMINLGYVIKSSILYDFKELLK